MTGGGFAPWPDTGARLSDVIKPSFLLPSRNGPIDPDVSSRINVLRIILIGLIIIGHGGKAIVAMVPAMGPVMTFTLATISGNVDYSTVPLFFAISGYLFLRRFELGKASYLTMLRKKFFGLFVPFVLFNLIWILWLYAVGSIEMFGSWTSVADAGVVNKLFGIGTLPVNYPTWFLRDLLLIFLLSPVFVLLFKEMPMTGLIALFALWIGQNDGGAYSMYGHAFSFYAGGLLSRKNVNLRDTAGFDAVVLPGFAAATLFFIYKDAFALDPAFAGRLFKCYSLFGVVFFWCLSRRRFLKDSRLLQRMAGYSFFIFLCHEPTLSILQTSIIGIWRPQSDLEQVVFYFGTGLGVIFLLFGLGMAFSKYAPRVYGFCVGSHTGRRPLAQG